MKKVTKLLFATVFLIILTGAAYGDTWTLANSNGGDGYVVWTATGFQLWGADNAVGPNYTTYTFTAGGAESLSIPWAYSTLDCCGSYWDPAGYVLNGVYTQLSTNCNVQFTCDTSGTLNIALNAGDNFGFYVYSLDSIQGRAAIDVTTPEPATMALFGSGLLGLAGAIRRKLSR